MKSLLTVVGSGPVEPVLETALLVARRFDGHIIGFPSLGAEYADSLGWKTEFSISSEFDRAREREGHQLRDRAEVSFRAFMHVRGIPPGPVAAGHGPSASWSDNDARQRPAVGTIGRVCDLIVLQQPEKLASIDGISLEDALFASGRPVLIVPKTPPPALGEVIAIAWNGSAETAHAVALGMPFLKKARQVVVVAVDSRDMPEPGPSGRELACALERHGLNVSLRAAAGRQKRQGASFLGAAVFAGADLLLKGAYTRSRLRQMIFGGATRHIILTSPMPVLIAR